jgi:glutaredoxin
MTVSKKSRLGRLAWGYLLSIHAQTPTIMRFVHGILALLALGSCKRESIQPPTDPSTARAIRRDAALLFTYIGRDGVFATTDKAEIVPEATRRVVRVMGRTNGEAPFRNDVNVDVIDLRELLAAGETWTRMMAREMFETSALAQLPFGDSCPLAGPHGPALAEEPIEVPLPDEPPIVILYGTNGCKACMDARRYLRSNRIPFTLKDAEGDPEASREMRDKAAHFGLQSDRVPILDIRGRLVVGFTLSLMDGLLADW